MCFLALAVSASGYAPAARGTSAGKPPKEPREASADWVPLRGRIRVGRTWGHPGGHGYPSIDFIMPAGKSVPVYAAGPGTVIAVLGSCPDSSPGGEHTGCNGGVGNFVELVHPDGRRSRYQHLRQSSVTVQPGEYVCRGCRIGRSGWSGNVSPSGPEGAHLHYEELRGFRLVDPGPMRAKRQNGRVSYPGPGLHWQRVGGEGLVIRNTGFPRPDPGPIAYCRGWAATRVGTSGPDQLRGTAGPDIIVAGDGSDSIHGLDGDDRLCGGTGDDLLVGGPQHDTIDGGDGTDTCYPDEEDGYQTAGQGTLVSCERPPYVLTVEVACCFRFVTSQPVGISCPPDCSEPYPPLTQVTLSLSTGSSRWRGCDTEDGTNYGPTCSVTMTADRHVSV